MAAWAYECRPADASLGRLLVACLAVDAMPTGTSIVRVKVGKEWRCAVVDTSRKLESAGMLLRDAVASDATDCPECAVEPVPRQLPDARDDEPPKPSGRQVQGAAIAMQGHRFVVVLVGIDLVRSAGEAEMAIADMRPRFGGVDIVLMGQLDDGTPVYHGDPELLALLAELPVDRMPWKAYPIG